MLNPTPSSMAALTRPVLFDEANEARSQYQTLRYQMLIDDFGDALEEWLEDTVGKDYAEVWGHPDTSMNPLSSQTRQLTTPGTYGRAPTRRGPDNGDLVGPRGSMRRYWPRMQAVEYLTVGMGVWFQTVSMTKDGTNTYRSVKPFNVVVWVDEADACTPVRIWELRLREVELIPGQPRKQVYTWDQWDLGDEHLGGTTPASYRVMTCNLQGQPVEDVSSQVIRDGEGNYREALVGPDYWWRKEDGTPVLPWLVHRAVDDGEFWPHYRRTMHTGTLRACTLWTYVHRSALFATGEHTLVAGVDPTAVPGTAIKRGDHSQDQSSHPIVTMPIHPGSITFLPPVDGQNLQTVSIKAGVNLSSLSAFASLFQMLLANADGLNPSDAMRRSANPASGASLAISAASRREFSASVRPLFLETDLEAIELSALVRNLSGFPTPSDPKAYTIEYHAIPLTPTEQKDLRDQVTWEESNGKLGPVEAYQRVHPGVDYETALQAVVSAAVEKAKVQALIDAALKEAGLSRPTPPGVGAEEDGEEEPEEDDPSKEGDDNQPGEEDDDDSKPDPKGNKPTEEK